MRGREEEGHRNGPVGHLDDVRRRPEKKGAHEGAGRQIYDSTYPGEPERITLPESVADSASDVGAENRRNSADQDVGETDRAGEDL